MTAGSRGRRRQSAAGTPAVHAAARKVRGGCVEGVGKVWGVGASDRRQGITDLWGVLWLKAGASWCAQRGEDVEFCVHTR